MEPQIHTTGANIFQNLVESYAYGSRNMEKPGNKMIKHVLLSCDIAMFLLRPSSPTVHLSGIRVDDKTPPEDDRLKEAKLKSK